MKWLALSTLLVTACAHPAEPPRATTPPAATITAPPVAPPASAATADTDAPAPPRTTPRPSDKRTATDAPATHLDDTGCRVPWDYDVGDILEAIDPDPVSRKTASARILTWLIEVDDRPLLIDRAILWVHYQFPNGKDSWTLAHLYRHPLDERRTEWQVSRVYDVPYVGQRPYAVAPRAAELETFLNETWWRFDAIDAFRLLDADICTKAWTDSIGSAPNHQYP
jgi:hypothetical protein